MKEIIWITLKPNIYPYRAGDGTEGWRGYIYIYIYIYIASPTQVRGKSNEWTEEKRERMRKEGRCSFSTKCSSYRNCIIFHAVFMKSNKVAFCGCIRLWLSDGHKNDFLFPKFSEDGLLRTYVLHSTVGYLTGTNAINTDRWTLHNKKQEDGRNAVTRPARAADVCRLKRPSERNFVSEINKRKVLL
jgi:hypothetical protein